MKWRPLDVIITTGKNQRVKKMTINEGLYCEVDPGNPVAVDAGPNRLPQNWMSPYDGQWHFNINVVENKDDNALRSIGQYPYMLIDAGAPGNGYTRSLGAFVVTATHATQTAEYTQRDIEEVRQEMRNQIEQQIIEYRPNEIAADDLLSENVRVEQAWAEGKIIELFKLTDWQAVADFDTSKPAVLPIPNSFQGARYVQQGLRMQAQNDAAVNAGLVAPWDSTALTTFVAANEAAAQDITDATPVAAPDFKLRQGSVTPKDRFSSLLIYRSKRNYGAGHENRDSLEFVLLNKEDERPLYAFLYLQSGTYLEWVQFTRVFNGTWRANSSVNVYSWMASDLKIIMSYGTNPAVQQDFFTNELMFDAGGQQQLVRVRWDVE